MPTRLDLVRELLTLHEEFRRIPTEALMAGQGTFDPEHYHDEFGSWDQALTTVGFDPDQRAQERYDIITELNQSQRDTLKSLLNSNDSDEFFRGQLLAELTRLAIELGKSPSGLDMRNYGRYSDSTYIRHFESWSVALKEAGIEPNHGPKPISDEKLLAELRRVAESVNEPIRAKHMRDMGNYSVPTYCSHFGSWSEACEMAGTSTTPP